MEGDEIGIVLARASELRSKITNCVEKAKGRTRYHENEEEEEIEDEGGEHNSSMDGSSEAESLSNILDALESLEEQLTSLQVLQQQQRYERGATLAEIDHSRKILLKKLKEYKGNDLEVIHEACAFASETVEHSDDLLLPPYPRRHLIPLILDNGCTSSVPSTRKYTQNGDVSPDTFHETKKTSGLEKKQSQSPIRDSPTGLRHIISAAAKTLLTLVSVASVLSIAGFEPSLRRRNTQSKVLHLLQHSAAEEKKATIQCPPGKVLVMEDGEPRCLVKERVEIPFEPVVTMPNVNYGCG
ncbi:hypothetical protein BVC80_8893g41 [Macleaya cordata]|uniref:Plastid division protein PDV2 n=1 Tax=Macleaya cordata TaxID=56857 RepID=A0A200Q408_MACCD|nr:hypothetical protein BVC80_8893g41 [Macleaya cordata]